jgi:hypothetical protein
MGLDGGLLDDRIGRRGEGVRAPSLSCRCSCRRRPGTGCQREPVQRRSGQRAFAAAIQKQTFVGLASTTLSAQPIMSALEGVPVRLMVPRAAQCDPCDPKRALWVQSAPCANGPEGATSDLS